jgi:hypothetical protein
LSRDRNGGFCSLLYQINQSIINLKFKKMSVNKVDAIISSINKLTDEEKRELTIKVRTTPEGIKAYTSFLYGIGGKASQPPKEDQDCETTKHETPNGDNNSGSGSSTNSSEEWL